jgi:hypothetical protein
MFATADRPITIIVDLDVVGSPRQRDGEVRSDAEADRRAQALRPGADRAERGLRPVHRSDKLAHLSAAQQKIGLVRTYGMVVVH